MNHTKEYYESFIGKTFKGFRFDDDDYPTIGWGILMEDTVGQDFVIEFYKEYNNSFMGNGWSFPADLVIEQILQSEQTDTNPQPHYSNESKTFRSLFELSNVLKLNEWEFDILKRLVRCRKKGQFAEDLQKIKDTVDIYREEYDESTN